MVMPRPTLPNYDTKFAGFILMCRDAKKSGLEQIVIAHPSAIGDNYEEIVESLSRLAAAGLRLAVARPESPPNSQVQK